MLICLYHLPVLSPSFICMPCSVFCLLLRACSLVSANSECIGRLWFFVRKYVLVLRHYFIWQLSLITSHRLV
jgi:hypothetical protein